MKEKSYNDQKIEFKHIIAFGLICGAICTSMFFGVVVYQDAQLNKIQDDWVDGVVYTGIMYEFIETRSKMDENGSLITVSNYKNITINHITQRTPQLKMKITVRFNIDMYRDYQEIYEEGIGGLPDFTVDPDTMHNQTMHNTRCFCGCDINTGCFNGCINTTSIFEGHYFGQVLQNYTHKTLCEGNLAECKNFISEYSVILVRMIYKNKEIYV